MTIVMPNNYYTCVHGRLYAKKGKWAIARRQFQKKSPASLKYVNAFGGTSTPPLNRRLCLQ